MLTLNGRPSPTKSADDPQPPNGGAPSNIQSTTTLELDRVVAERDNPIDTLMDGTVNAGYGRKPTLEAAQKLLDAMLNSPEFRDVLLLYDIAKEMRDAATDMLENGSGDVDERLMAILNETIKLAEQIIDVAKNTQDADGRMISTVAEAIR